MSELETLFDCPESSSPFFFLFDFLVRLPACTLAGAALPAVVPGLSALDAAVLSPAAEAILPFFYASMSASIFLYLQLVCNSITLVPLPVGREDSFRKAGFVVPNRSPFLCCTCRPVDIAGGCRF